MNENLWVCLLYYDCIFLKSHFVLIDLLMFAVCSRCLNYFIFSLRKSPKISEGNFSGEGVGTGKMFIFR